MRVFLDTNVLASGLATRGLCSDVVRTTLELHELVVSERMLGELDRILRTKFGVPEDAIAEALAACQRPLGTLSVKVSVEHVLWHLARSRYYAEALKRPLPVCVGARAAGGTAMALWAPEYRLGVLQVLTLYLQPGADRAAMDGVLTAGRRLAAELGLSTLEIWENPHNAGFLAGGERISSTKDLPMLLGLEPGVRGEDWLDYERAHWL